MESVSSILFRQKGTQLTQVFVTTSAFGADTVKEHGQAAFVPIVALAGGNGIEIRRELLGPQDRSLSDIGKTIRDHQLTCVYSAPVELWRQDGKLNTKALYTVISEAIQLGANLVKFSLGYFEQSLFHIKELQYLLRMLDFPRSPLQITVENDQTIYGGSIQPLKDFFKACAANQIPIGMTFDIGN